MTGTFWRISYLLVFFLVGCGLTGPVGSPPSAGSPEGSAAASQTKTIIASSLNPIKAFGAWDGGNAGGTYALHDIHTSPLFTTDVQGNVEGRLVSKLPSLEDGTMAILPDGSMRTTWNLRAGVKWHDGTVFTSEDLAFTFQVYRDPDVPFVAGSAAVLKNNIERIDALDPAAAIVTWKRAYFQPSRLDLHELWPLPKHILAAAFEGDKQNFRSLPYWTTEYVNTGPFRLVDYGLGEDLVFERFDDYFLGTPKVNRIVIRILRDPNVLFANLQAGAIDIASRDAMQSDTALLLDAEWRKTGEGSVVFSPGSFRFAVVQFDPQLARPPELSRDVVVREGLLMGVDRESLREVMLPGVANTAANSFLPELDPKTPSVGKPFSRYPYDPRAAAQRLEAAGWRRDTGGRLLNQAGEQVEISFRVPTSYLRLGAIVAQHWRDLGIQATEVEVTSAVESREYNATFPAFSSHANDTREGFFSRLLSTAHATPQTQYVGSNTGHYTNVRLDQLFGVLSGTPDQREQIPLLRDLGEILATDLPVLPMFYTVSHAAVRKGVHALVDDYTGSDATGSMSRNAYLWNRD